MKNEAVESRAMANRPVESRAGQGRTMGSRVAPVTGRDVSRERSGYDISEIQRRVDDLVSIATALAAADTPDTEPSPAVARLWVEVKLLAAAVQPVPAGRGEPAVPESREWSVDSPGTRRFAVPHRSVTLPVGHPVPSATDYWFG